MKVEMGKEYRTREGREVRLYALDGGGTYPVQGAVRDGTGWIQQSWAESGVWMTSEADHDNNLEEVKPRIKRTVWLNVYGVEAAVLSITSSHCSKGEADCLAAPYRKACIRVDIDCEEGEGLERTDDHAS